MNLYVYIVYLIAYAITLPKFIVRINYSKDTDDTYDLSYVSHFIFHVHIIVLYITILIELFRIIVSDLRNHSTVIDNRLYFSESAFDFGKILNVLIYLFVTTVPINIFTFQSFKLFFQNEKIHTIARARSFIFMWTFLSMLVLCLMSYLRLDASKVSYDLVDQLNFKYPDTFFMFIFQYMIVLVVYFLYRKKNKLNTIVKTETDAYKNKFRGKIDFIIRLSIILGVMFQIRLE